MRRDGPLLNVHAHQGEHLVGTILFYRDQHVARLAVSQSKSKKTGPAWAVGSVVYYGTKTRSVDARVRHCMSGTT